VATGLNEPLQLQELTIPALHPQELLVRILNVGVCHAELSILNGTIPSSFPRVLGHEGAGIIVSTGSDVKDQYRAGERVLLSFAFCAECNECQGGHPAYCDKQFEVTWSGDSTSPFKSATGELVKSGFFGQSSFAEYAVVDATSIVRAPNTSNGEMEILAPLGCAVQTGVGTMTNVLDVKAGMSVVVFGAGAVGMCAIMGAKLRGAKNIIAVDLNEDRLKLAQDIGATHGVISAKDASETILKIKEICGAGVDRAVDTTGVAAVVETMVDLLRTRGKAAIVGAPRPGTKVGVEVVSFLQNGKTLVGAVEGDSIPSDVSAHTICVVPRQHY
jgi:aryl-alcohol dehydrogenase